MDRLEILDTIYKLAQSQGFYGRLYARLNELAEEDPDAYEEVMQGWENQNFKDAVDFVIYVET